MGLSSFLQTLKSVKTDLIDIKGDCVKEFRGRIVAYIPLPVPNITVLLNTPVAGMPSTLMNVLWSGGPVGGGMETNAWPGIGQTVIVHASKNGYYCAMVLNDLTTSPKNIAASYEVAFSPTYPAPPDGMTYIPGVGLTIMCGTTMLIIGPVGINMICGGTAFSITAAGISEVSATTLVESITGAITKVAGTETSQIMGAIMENAVSKTSSVPSVTETGASKNTIYASVLT